MLEGMPKKIDYTLTREDLSVVRRAMASDKRPEVRQRATAIHLLHQGWKAQEVAEALAVSFGSVYKWYERWCDGGLDGLANRAKTGTKPKADESYWQRVGELVELEPQTLGYEFTLWTAARLIAHMAAETGVELSVSRFRAVLKKRGYVYRRPKHDLKSLQDPEARAAAEAWLEELKKVRLPESSTSSLWMKRP
jgi:transposase